MKAITKNTLFYGDNLEILQEYIPIESVDLIYLDPPFNSNRTYSVLFKDERGMESEAQINAFDDTWHWNERFFRRMMQTAPVKVASMLDAMHGFIGENQMMAYLVMMAARLVELHRVLKPTGSLYLHCDPSASHYLKVVLDTIFGVDNFRSEVIWKRTFSHNSAKRYGPVHDSLLFYSKSSLFIWNDIRSDIDLDYVRKHFTQVDKISGKKFQPITLTGSGIRGGESGKPWKNIDPTKVNRHWALPGKILTDLNINEGSIQEKLNALDESGRIYWPEKENGTPRLKWFDDDIIGTPVLDVWTDIFPIGAQAAERLGYPTQKPLALLERIILASSNPGDIVLDPFSGCGTAIAAAQKLGRRWIGIDITHLAIAMHKSRLRDMFGIQPEKDYDVVGEPVDLNGAEALFRQNAYQFQWWAVSLIGAKPQGGDGGKAGKKGSDRGIDGVIIFTEDLKGRAGKILVQVKGGGVKSGDVRDLRGVIERENAAMGIFLTLKPSTSEMRVEADKAGMYHSDLWSKDYPRLQIVTVEDLLNGRMPDLPRWLDDPHKKAVRVKDEGGQIEMEI